MRSSRSARTLKISIFSLFLFLAVAIVPQTTSAANPLASVLDYGQLAFKWLMEGSKSNDQDPKGDKPKAIRPASPYIPGEEPQTKHQIADISGTEMLAPACSQNANPPIPVVSGGSIQAAINAADPAGGSTISVAAGTYSEQLTINKCVFIVGSGVGQTIIKSPPTLTPTTVTGITGVASIVEVRANSFVTMSGVQVEGFLSFTNANEYGIFIAENGTLKLTDAKITNIRQSTGVSGIQNGRAVYVGRSTGGTIGSIDFKNVVVDQFNKSGIFVDRTGSHARLENVTVSGIGPTGLIAQNGVTVINGATAEIIDSAITGHNYTPSSSSSAGVLAIEDRGLTISGSTFSGNNYGVRRQLSTLLWPTSINSNRIEGNDGSGVLLEYSATAPAVAHDVHFNFFAANESAVINDSGITVNATNNFWGCNAGPTNTPVDPTDVGVCDTISGTGAITHSPWLRLTGLNASPASVENDDVSTISGASLRLNSDNLNTFTTGPTAGQSVPDGIGITYSVNSPTYGGVTPTAGTFTDGIATGTTFTAAAGPFIGDQNVTVSGQVNNATTSAVVTVEDTTVPTATITQAAGQADPTSTAPVNFTLTFSESVTVNEAAIVASSSGSGSIVTSVTGAEPGTTFNIQVSGMTSNGIITVSVPAGSATDEAGNASTAAATGDNQVAYFSGSIELVVDDATPTPINCTGNGAPVYPTIQSAVAAASAGYTIKVCSGTYQVDSTTTVSIPNLTIENAESTSPVVEVTGSNLIFTVLAPNVTLRGLDIQKTDTAAQNVVQIQGSGFKGLNNKFTALPWSGTGTTRAFEISSSATGLLLDGNTITDFRQPAYINGDGSVLGTISNNNAVRTKGWVNDGAAINFIGNSFTTCAACGTEIALLNRSYPGYQSHYSNRLALSAANSNAHIDVQFTPENDSGRGISYVATTGNQNNGGTASSPYASIQQAIFVTPSDPDDRIDGTLPGGTINVAAGNYSENVEVNRTLKLVGAGYASTTITGPIGGPFTTVWVTANNVDISGFTITRAGNNTTDWDNPGLKTAGIAMQSMAVSGTVIHNNRITGMRTAIDVNNSNGHTIRDNRIDNNRTGLIFRNQTDDMTVVENEITDNWTVGILFLDGSNAGTGTQQAKFGTFSNNNISGNWWGQIVDRQAGGSLPAAGTNLKNFQGNWYGTATPVVTTDNSTEPGYSALIPVAFGGTATAPGGQPDIAGPASANFLYKQNLQVSTDNDAGLGFSGEPIQTAAVNSNSWFSLNEMPTGSSALVAGPGGTGAYANGSGRLIVDATGRQNFATLNYRGVQLRDITSLKYSTYRETGTGVIAPSLQMDIDFDVTDSDTTYQGRLVYEPYMDPTNTVQNGVWQVWDLFAPTARFYGSTTSTIGAPPRPISELCPQSTPCSLATILNAFPNAGIRDSALDGRILLRAGGPWASGFTGYVDNLQIGVGGTVTTHDFVADVVSPTTSLSCTLAGACTVTFNENMIGFTAGDISTTAGTVESFAGSGAVYTFTLQQSTTLPATASISAGVATDEAGNPNAASGSATIDIVGPTVTINEASGQDDPTNASPILFDVAFSEPVTGFTGADVSLVSSTTGGTLTAVVSPTSGPATNFTVSVSGMSGSGLVIASVGSAVVSDGYGNPNVPSTSSDNQVEFNPTNTAVVVSPTNLQNWFFLNDNGTGTATGSLVSGIGTPPAGVGSARFEVDQLGGYVIGTLQYGGTRLDQITEMKYSTYQNNSSNPALSAQAISIQFEVDSDITDGNTAFQGRLVFEPYQTPSNTIQQGVWQEWSPLNGRWWGTGSTGRPISIACPQSAPCTWATILASFPNAGIRATGVGPGSGGLFFKAGSGWNPSGGPIWNGNVDRLVLGLNSSNTTVDFEPTPPVVSISGFTAPEGNTGTTTADLIVSLSTQSQLDTTVTLTVADGTAVAGSDYTVLSPQTITIPAGDTEVEVQVTIIGDTVYEPITNETLTATISNAINGVISPSANQATGTITDDDAQPVVQFSSATYSQNESGNASPTLAALTLTRTGASGNAISIDLATSGGSATGGASCTAGVDYITPSSLVTWAANDTASKTINVTVCGDTNIEGLETVGFAISNPTGGASIGTPNAASLTIRDGNISISGTITTAPTVGSLSGVTVTLAGTGSATTISTITLGDGSYTFTGLRSNANYLVTPSVSSKAFEPLERSYVSVTSNVTNANFAGYDTTAIPRNLRVETGVGSVTGTGVVPIHLTSSLSNVNGMSFSIDFDQSILSFQSAVCGTGAPAGCTVNANVHPGTGNLAVSLDLPDGVSFAAGDRQAIRLTFINFGTVVTTPSLTTPMAFVDAPTLREAVGVDGNPVPSTYTNGNLVMGNLEGDVSPRSTTASGNGVVTGADAAQISRFAAFLDFPHGNSVSTEFQRADTAPVGTSGNGSITGADAAQARRYAASLDPIQPAAGPGNPSPLVESLKKDIERASKNVLGGTSLSIPVIAAGQGSVATVNVLIDAQGIENSIAFTLLYDATKLRILNPNTDVIPGTGAVAGNGSFPGLTVNRMVDGGGVDVGRVGIILGFNANQAIAAGSGRQIVRIQFQVLSSAAEGLSAIEFVGGPPVALETVDTMINEVPTFYATGGGVNVLAPTAAAASIGGTVTGADLRPVSGAVVNVADENGVVNTLRTNTFGRFRFDGLMTGRSYVVSVMDKRNSYASQLIVLNDSVTGISFTPSQSTK